MATLKSVATGNFSSSSTWALCEGSIDTDSTSSALSTVYAGANNYTPASNIDVQGVCLKVAARFTTIGTMSIEIYNVTAAAQVAGTEVTVDIADIGAGNATDKASYWHYFRFTTPVTLTSGTNYVIRAKNSASGTNINLYRNATASGWDRQFVTTTNQAPIAGDTLIILGDKTGSGTFNSYSITMNSTSSTDYGSGSTTVTSIFVGHDATFSYGTSAATNYILRISGILAVGSGGTFNIGTAVTPIPRDSTAILEFDCASDGQFGLEVRGGNCNLQGLSRSSGKNIDRCFLTTDEIIGQTTLEVDEDTGWLSGDEIAISATNRTATQHEQHVLASNALSSSLSIVSSLIYIHLGNSNTAAEVILLTRNVKICSVSTTFMTYVDVRNTAIVDFDWVEFRYIGANATGKFGVSLNTVSGSANVNNCVARNSEFAGFVVDASGAANVNIIDCITYSTTGAGNRGGFHVGITTVLNTVIFNNCLAMAPATYGFFIGSVNAILDSCRAVSCPTAGIYLSDGTSTTSTGYIENLYIRSCGSGIFLSNLSKYFINNSTVRLTNTQALLSQGNTFVEFNNFICTGCASGILCNQIMNWIFNDSIFAGEVSGSNSTLRWLLNSNGGGGYIYCNRCTIGSTSGDYSLHTSNSMFFQGAALNVMFNKTVINDASEIGGQTAIRPDCFVSFQANDNVANNHKLVKRQGTISYDSTILDGGIASSRLTTSASLEKLESEIFFIPINDGETVDISVRVRKSVIGDGTAYNGNEARLIIKADTSLGIDSDVVLDSSTAASNGAFESIFGTSPIVTASGVLKVIVDCDGTTGWINIANWTSSLKNDSKGLSYWVDGSPKSYPGSSATVGFAFIQ